ncbi:heparanase-like [Microplitis mediator]|uniref:heparanase-like n=1 Tax=Microplitis mediator TaxID=375433 RepID=UPI0025568163|nr:heparanase-like [Microplitis mediator]XP_057339842.1 heparanase-like [Microplitis mediator]XP_057339843.1 heparanase-like [Microplitis mediator]
MSYFENNIWSKNEYHTLGRKENDQAGKSIIGSIVVGIFLILLVISLWNIGRHNLSKTYVVIIDTNSNLLHKTSERYLSFGLDSSLLRDMDKFPVKNDTFVNLARYLSPAFVRVGGTSADCIFFNQPVPEVTEKITSPVDAQDISNFTLAGDDYLAVYQFTERAQLRMMFDLNALIRDPDDHWDDTNAKDIINFSKGHSMDIDWQLGNEPNSFRHVFNRPVSAKQLADDYIHLRRLLNQLGYETSFLVGPEVNHIGDNDKAGEKYATEFLKNNENSVDFLTWHQYYLNGREAKVADFINPNVFNRLPIQIKNVQDVIDQTNKNLKMWMSETSTAYGGGAPELSNRFVAGFLWLDKLGYGATAGVDVIVRQSFFGGNYSMIGKDLEPNPDWWVSVMYKQFVSSKVIQLKTPSNFGSIRLYGHCTCPSALISRVPAITVYGVNLNNDFVRISLLYYLKSYPRKNSKSFLYILTADYLQSRDIRLNGEILKLNSDGSLPAFKPVIVDSSQVITLPPFSMAFIIMHGVEHRACET